MRPGKRLALVLAGGAARGAYEVGVVDHILREVARDTGRPVRFDILCGTSVGALNACGIAAYADQGAAAADRLIDVWTKLDVSKLVAPDVSGILGIGARLLGRGASSPDAVPAREGGLLDGLQRAKDPPQEPAYGQQCEHVERHQPYKRLEGRVPQLPIGKTRMDHDHDSSQLGPTRTHQCLARWRLEGKKAPERGGPLVRHCTELPRDQWLAIHPEEPQPSAITSGAWFGSMTPPAPMRIVRVCAATCAMSTLVADEAIAGMLWCSAYQTRA